MDNSCRRVADEERRARIARRHGVAPGHRFPDLLAATRAMTVLHATEPATVLLSLAARVDGLTVAEVERALYDDRTLVKQLAMRRTLFVFPRELLPAAWGSPSARVAGTERRRMEKEAALHPELADGWPDGAAWLDDARDRVLAAVAERPGGLLAAELRPVLPELDGRVAVAPGSTWGLSRVLTHLGLTGDLVRGANTGAWWVSRPRWTLMEEWLGERPEPLAEREGWADLTRAWLRSFGPGTEDDLAWWLGATKTVVRAALAAVGAGRVELAGGATGWLLPDDVDPVPPVEPWAALLPVLDPTVMGWKERGFYLGAHGPALFDRTGNAGTTAWWDGRVVGCWVQDADGVVVISLLEDVGADGRAALAVEAERLTAWLAAEAPGRRIGSVYASTAMRDAVALSGA
jgi:hypothetical protein